MATSARQSMVIKAIPRVLLVVVFGVALLGKLADLHEAERSIAKLHWFPAELTPTLTALLLLSELVTILLLAFPRTVPAGATLGAAQGATFFGVTAVLLAQKRSTACGCFGVFIHLPPHWMLLVDAALVISGVLILRTHPFPKPASADGSGSPAPWNAVASMLRSRNAKPAVAIYALALAILATVAFGRSTPATAEKEKTEHSVLESQPAPALDTLLSRPRLLSAGASNKRWTLLEFVEPSCDPCVKQLREIAAQSSKLKDRLDILLIIPGQPLGRTADEAAQQFASRFNPPFSVRADPDYEITNQYADRPFRTPLSVLVDPSGIIRHVTTGRSATCDDSENFLITDIEALISRKPYRYNSPSDRPGPAFGRPASDAVVKVSRKAVKLSSYWKDQTLLLVFTQPNSLHLTKLRQRVQEVTATHPNTRALFVFSRVPPNWKSQAKVECAVDEIMRLRTTYHAWDPVTVFAIRNGTILIRSDDRAGWPEIRSVIQKGDAPIEALTLSRTFSRSQ